MKALLRIEDEQCFKAVNPEIIIDFSEAYQCEEEGSGEKDEEHNDEEKLDCANNCEISKDVDLNFEIGSD
jgi:hypothetical protein